MANLLVVEDEPVLARNLARAFANRGYDVRSATARSWVMRRSRLGGFNRGGATSATGWGNA